MAKKEKGNKSKSNSIEEDLEEIVEKRKLQKRLLKIMLDDIDKKNMKKK